MTLDLMSNVLEELSGKLKHVEVTEARDKTFYARLTVERANELIEIDSRPSDAIAMAVRQGCPILVNDELMAEKFPKAGRVPLVYMIGYYLYILTNNDVWNPDKAEAGMKRPWFHILLVMAEGTCHGAEIQRRVSDQASGKVRLYPVTLYRSLDELSARGFIEELPEPNAVQHNERRRYYGITPEGRKALGDEAEALEAVARMAHDALKTGSAS